MAVVITVLQGVLHLAEPLYVSLLFNVLGFRSLRDLLCGVYLLFFSAFLLFTLHDKRRKQASLSQATGISDREVNKSKEEEDEPGEGDESESFLRKEELLI